MDPKLYGITGSPPYGAVLMCAKVLGIELDLYMMDMLNGEHLKEDFIKKNPQHTVPLLEDNGFLLADSHAINGYLVGAYGKPNDPLYPKDNITRRAIIDHRLHLDSSILAAKGFLITRPLVMHNTKPDQKAFDGLREAFSILDKQIEVQNTKYIAEDVLSIADFSVTATVDSWGFFVKNWEADFPNIKAYMERMRREDWYQANEKGFQGFRALMGMKLEQFEKKSE